MNLDDLDATAIATGVVAVAIVIGVIILAVLGRAIPEVLVLGMTTVLGFLFGRGSTVPQSAAHTRALRENTVATREATDVLGSVPLVTAINANTAATAAAAAETAAQAAQGGG